MTDNLTTRIADRLKLLRAEQNLSLDELAEKSSISRATLSRMEKAEVSPTTEVLSKLCSAYGLTLTRLLSMTEESFQNVIRKEDQSLWPDRKTGFKRISISPPSAALKGEAIECELEADTKIHYEAPTIEGLEHHLILTSGRLSVTVDGKRHDLEAGDCLRYLTYGASTFQTFPEIPATYYLFMVP